jgi:hypothetical protein
MVTLFVFVSSDGVCALAVDHGGSVCTYELSHDL